MNKLTKVSILILFFILLLSTTAVAASSVYSKISQTEWWSTLRYFQTDISIELLSPLNRLLTSLNLTAHNYYYYAVFKNDCNGAIN